MVCKCFHFILEAFPKRHKWFSMQSCMQILNFLYIAQQLFWEMHQPSSPPSIHILLGLQITAPVPTVFTMTGAFFKASVPAIISACEHLAFNLLEVNAFKHHTNYYFQTIMEKIKYKPSEIQNLKMQNQKKANNICYFKTTGKKITYLKAYLKISEFRWFLSGDLIILCIFLSFVQFKFSQSA